MIPGQLIASGQLTDPRVNFASVHGLKSLTVQMNFSLPGATSRGGLPVVQHQVTGLAKVTFLHVNRRQKLPRGKSSLAHTQLLMFKINFPINNSRKHQKWANVFKIHSLSVTICAKTKRIEMTMSLPQGNEVVTPGQQITM